MKKVLVITYYWPPSGGAGVQRMLKFVKYMPQFGVEPIVLTIDENKAFYPLKDTSLLKDVNPDLKLIKTQNTEILKVFSKFLGKKEVPHSGFANHNKDTFISKTIRFLRGNLLIPDARKSWVNAAYKEAIKIIEQEKIDTIIISTPPHSSQLIGLKLKKKFPNLKWIADLRDPWTDIYYYKDLLHTSLAKKIDLKYEREVIKQANAVLVVSNGLKDLFSKKYNGVEQKIYTIPNGFDEDDFDIPSNPPHDEFLISHTGTLADTYRPEIFFKAFKKLIEKYGDQHRLRTLFVGKVSASILKMSNSFKINEYLTFHDYVPHSQVIQYQKNTTCLLLIIAEAANEKGLISGKIFEYLAARKPLIVIGPRHGDAEEIITTCEAGKIFSRDEEDALFHFMEETFEMWLTNKNLDLQHNKIALYSRKNLTEQLCKLIK